jgi:uncharacterized peroxidase-related enzyme
VIDRSVYQQRPPPSRAVRPGKVLPMTRLAALDPEKVPSPARELLAGVKGKLGLVPNMMRTMAASPAVLKAYLDFGGTLAGGRLSARLRERIALAVAEANRCGYCLAAHTTLGGMAGLQPAEMLESRRGRAADPRDAAAVRFAQGLVHARGDVTEADVQGLRAAGFGDAEIAEIVANVALNVFTNLFNHTAGTDIDFPAAPALA